MHNMAVNTINIHKRGAGCGRLNCTHNLQASGLKGFENAPYGGLEPIRLRGPDDPSFLAEFRTFMLWQEATKFLFLTSYHIVPFYS